MGIFGQRYSSSGSTLGTEFQVNTYTTSTQAAPDLASDANGHFVVWDSNQDGSLFGIFAQRYASDGSALGTEFQVNTYTTSDQLWPSVAVGTNGDFFVVWQSFSPGGLHTGVYGQRYDSTGGALGTEFQVNTYTTTMNVVQTFPAIAADPSGGFVVVWNHTQEGSNYGVFGQRFASDGSAVGTEFQVNTYTTGEQSVPSVTVDASGDFLVAWKGIDQDGAGIISQLFASSGNALGTELQVNTFTTDAQVGARVAALNGNFVVVWHNNVSGADADIAGQILENTPCPPTITPTATPTPTDTATATPTATQLTCPATPFGGCQSPGKSTLQIKDKNQDGAGADDKLQWNWKKGPLTMQSDFGDPTTTAQYTFCIYTGTAQTLTVEAHVPAGGTCGGSPCWKPISTTGYQRTDAAASTDGLAKIKLKGGSAGSAKIKVKGKDGNLDLTPATLPLDPTADVLVQLSNSDNSNCWESTFAPGTISKNNDEKYKATSP